MEVGVVTDWIARECLEPAHWLLVGLAAVTGLIHLGLGLAAPTTPIGAASILAGVGYGVGIALVLGDRYRRIVYALGVPYVASQIALWYLLQRPQSLGDVSPAAAVDKPVQVLLIAACCYLLVTEASS